MCEENYKPKLHFHQGNNYHFHQLIKQFQPCVKQYKKHFYKQVTAYFILTIPWQVNSVVFPSILQYRVTTLGSRIVTHNKRISKQLSSMLMDSILHLIHKLPSICCTEINSHFEPCFLFLCIILCQHILMVFLSFSACIFGLLLTCTKILYIQGLAQGGA